VSVGTISVHSEAWSAALVGPGDYLATGTFSGEWGDTLTVVSGTLPAGSPVKLRFELGLTSTATATGGGCSGSLVTRARVEASFSASATAGSSGGQVSVANHCEGSVTQTAAFIVDTVVGESMPVRGTLSGLVNSWAAAEFIDTMTSTADGVVDAGLQSHFYVDVFTADASYTTASGVTYAGAGPPPPCGNGVPDAGEACDDGNLADGDCCSSACQIEPAGTTCRAVAGACDVAETCDGTSLACPADAGLPDADADGVCDLVDLCTNVAGARDFHAIGGPIVRLNNVNLDTQPGNDGLTLRAEFDLPAGTSFSDLAFDTTGLLLRLTSATGTVRLDAALPAGAPAEPGTRGWTRAASGQKWTYADDTLTPIGSIKKLRVVARDGAGGSRVRVVARGQDGAYGVMASDLPVQVLLVLDGTGASLANRCAESSFAASECALAANGERVVCRY
jgi:cysteine-rich repeat protein